MAAIATLLMALTILGLLGARGTLTDPDLGGFFFRYAFSFTGTSFVVFFLSLVLALIVGSTLTAFWKMHVSRRFAFGAVLLLIWSAYNAIIALPDEEFGDLAIYSFMFHLSILTLTYFALRRLRP